MNGDLERIDLVDPAIGEELVAPCNESVSINFTTGDVACTLPSTYPARLDPEGAFVRVTVGGQQSLSAGTVNGMQIIGAPTVDLVQPSEGPNEGGTQIVLTCGRIGDESDTTAVTDVRFNGQAVPFSRTGRRTIQIESIPGAGAGRLIEVVTRGGLASIPPGRFSFEVPEIADVRPAYSLIGEFLANFTVTGSGFGYDTEDVESLHLGGVPCGSIIRMSSTLLRCLDLPCSQLTRASEALSKATVTVAGQTSFPSLAFEAVEDPIINRISPEREVAGQVILVLGRNFGY